MTSSKRRAQATPSTPPPPWNKEVCLALLEQLWTLRQTMLDREARHAAAIEAVGAQQRDSARNLIHYLALRTTDLRAMQEQLNWLGVSSLGRAESHVLANVDKVIGILHRLTGQPWQDHSMDEPAGSVTGRQLLQDHAERLLGAAQRERSVRIMVTLPSEAASDYGLVRRLVHAGMDVARINCAHDDAAAWASMALLVRRAAKAAQRKVHILMDLGGPKIRTAAMAPGPTVIRLKPERDALGYATAPSRLRIDAAEGSTHSATAQARIVADAAWLARLRVGKQIEVTDARAKKRRLLVVECDAGGAVAECLETYYLTPDTALSCKGSHGHKVFSVYPGGIEPLPGALRLRKGDRFQLTREGLGGEDHIACTLPQVFGQVHAGERVWFDDGRIGGVVRKASAKSLEVEIVQEAADVYQLLHTLRELGGEQVGLVLKIETLKGFENLPGLMLAAMAAPSAGVMIARGDLAVECGYERLAEVQEEILWCAQAAHMPVIWATQVLETLAKSGLPSRAEISDAGMGVRAECVMLNKGPYITEAIQMLDDILRRMSGHQAKKSSLLRALRAWEGEAVR